MLSSIRASLSGKRSVGSLGPIKVISLQRGQERRRLFEDSNKGLSYEFFDAVDGRALTAEQRNNPEWFRHPLPFPSDGAYGVALSHLQLWEQVIASGKAMTIAEDDAIFRTDFDTQSESLVSELPKDWDFILWSWNFDSILSFHALPGISPTVMLFNQDSLRENLESFRTRLLRVQAYRLDKCFGIPAYTISPRGAARFKSLCFPLENFELPFPVLNRSIPNTGVDIAMNRIYSITNSFVCFPPLAVTPNDLSVSTIQVASASSS